MPDNLAVPILSGPARGMRWITGSATHACWLGTYEKDRQRRILEVLHTGDCFLDIGANAGFYSMLASRIVGADGQVHAFEPFPGNVAYLNRHVELNRLANVSVWPIALSDGPERTMSFDTSINSCCGKLQAELSRHDGIKVDVASLDTLWERGTFPQASVIKIDVEGAEFSVLQGGRNMLNECRPVILLAGHGTAVQEQCCELLEGWGYRLQIDRDGLVDGMYESTAWPG
jgi:FkbM family methyltransferase